MKRLLSALLVLILCLSAALAEDVEYTAEPEAAAPAVAEMPAPAEEPAPQPEHEADPEPEAEPDGDSAPIDDMMFPEGEQPLIMPVPEIPAQYEGYIRSGDDRIEGTLAELLAEAGAKTVYVSAKESVRIEGFRLTLFKDVKLLPDPEVFSDDYAVALAANGEALDPETLDFSQDEIVTLTVSVVKREEPKPEDPEPKPGEDQKVALKVTPRNYSEGEWQSEIPSFLLEGIPEGDGGYDGYAAIIYDERIVPLAGDEYFAQEEGEYVVRFAILDALGDIADKSEKYALKLDFTAPELMIEVSEEHDYTMTLRAEDALSGVVELSLDGGATWVPLNEGESVVHTEARRKVFAPGEIVVRDVAGNLCANDVEIALDAIPREPAVESWGGGGGGGGDASPTAAPHASGDGDASPYDAYELALPEGAVDVLTLGGEEIDLGLEIASGDIPDALPGLFTAELTAWAVESGEFEPSDDTLVLCAETGVARGAFTCTWRINGAVLRKLYNTDIRYLALAAGDAVLSLPTVGFTAGTRYAELKMEGVSTASFEYEIVMHINPGAEGPAPAEDGWNMIVSCEPEIYVEVEGERFDMIDRLTTPEMYPFDVYCGPADLPEYPYGEYPRAEVEVW